jgi:hypothetical protein
VRRTGPVLLVAILGVALGGLLVARHDTRDSVVTTQGDADRVVILAGTGGVWPQEADRPATVRELADRFAREVLGWTDAKATFKPVTIHDGTGAVETGDAPTNVTLTRGAASVRFFATPTADARWLILQVGPTGGAVHLSADLSSMTWETGSIPSSTTSARSFTRHVNGSTTVARLDPPDRMKVPFPLASFAYLVLFYDRDREVVGAVGGDPAAHCGSEPGCSVIPLSTDSDPTFDVLPAHEVAVTDIGHYEWTSPPFDLSKFSDGMTYGTEAPAGTNLANVDHVVSGPPDAAIVRYSFDVTSLAAPSTVLLSATHTCSTAQPCIPTG